MKAKVLLVLAGFIITMLLAACDNNIKIDVGKYRDNLKSSQKNSMSIEQRDKIQKSIFPNIKQSN